MPISDKEQMQIVRGWWKEYGYYLLFTVVFFMAASFGWRYWQQHHQSTLEYSSAGYMQLLASSAPGQEKSEEAKLFADSLTKDYSGSPYASLASLVLAKTAVEKGDLEGALSRLQFVVKGSSDKKIKQLARIRAARILVALKKPQEALTLLSTIDDKVYAAEIRESKGDALLADGKTKEAEEAYREAEKLSIDKKSMSPLLKIKLQQF